MSQQDNTTCQHRIEVSEPSVLYNASTPVPRCLLKLPDHWNEGAKQAGSLRWIGSGGSPLVLGCCDVNQCQAKQN